MLHRLLLALDIVDLQVDNDAEIALQDEVGVESVVRVLAHHLRGAEAIHHRGTVRVAPDLEVGSQNK